MTRQRLLVVLLCAALAATTYWLATRTEWVDIEVPMPARGEARTNQSYAAQRFVEALGAHASRDLELLAPSPASATSQSSAGRPRHGSVNWKRRRVSICVSDGSTEG